MKLDNNPVTPEERAICLNIAFNIDITANESNFKSEKTPASEYFEEKKPRPSSNYSQPVDRFSEAAGESVYDQREQSRQDKDRDRER